MVLISVSDYVETTLWMLVNFLSRIKSSSMGWSRKKSLISISAELCLDNLEEAYFLSEVSVSVKIALYICCMVVEWVTKSSTRCILSVSLKSEYFTFDLTNCWSFCKAYSIPKPSEVSIIMPFSEVSTPWLISLTWVESFLSFLFNNFSVTSFRFITNVFVLSIASIRMSSNSDLSSARFVAWPIFVR